MSLPEPGHSPSGPDRGVGLPEEAVGAWSGGPDPRERTPAPRPSNFPSMPYEYGPREIRACAGRARCWSGYFVILVTRPAPTVRPPSRMANRSDSSMAIGWISSTDISVLSPGMTISVPSGSVTTPVTSVVRK